MAFQLNESLRTLIRMGIDFAQDQLQSKIVDEVKREQVKRAIDKAQLLLDAVIDDNPNNVDQILDLIDA